MVQITNNEQKLLSRAEVFAERPVDGKTGYYFCACDGQAWYRRTNAHIQGTTCWYYSSERDTWTFINNY